jgi:CRP-like cAMP-binding protein
VLLVTREEVWKAVALVLREDCGKLLDVRDVRRVRRVAGEAWIVTVVLAAPSGDLHVADVTVEDGGEMSPRIGPEHVIEAVRKAQSASPLSAAKPPDELGDFGDALSSDADPALDMLQDDEPIEQRVSAALSRGDAASLREAQQLLPRLLTDHNRRGTTLLAMAAVETGLGDKALARGYLEAGAREFADRFDLDSLEKAATLAMNLVGKDVFLGSPVHTLLEQSRARLKPLESIYDSRSFAGLRDEIREKLDPVLTLRTLAPQETLVNEGEPSRNVFVVKSGLLGVWLEKPSGGQWLVRSCFPGWLLGESSVLGGLAPRCTATLRAERISEVWTLSATDIRTLMDADPAFRSRIRETKQIHRIDSFFSMHETMGQLDVQVRDEMLSCIQRLETFDKDTVVLPANQIPKVACLVARGSITLYADSTRKKQVGSIEADWFYGVRDSIHAIAPSLEAVAREGTTIAFFDGVRLAKLCERSPEHVVAVLERLG